MKTAGLLQPTGLVVAMARLYICLSLSCFMHHELAMALNSGGIIISPNIRVVDVSVSTLSFRQRTLFCYSSVPSQYKGKVQHTLYHWHFRSVQSSRLSRSQSLTVVPKSVNDTGEYICCVTYLLQTGMNRVNQVTHNFHIDLIVVNNPSEFNCAIMPFFTRPSVGAQSCTNTISTSVVYAEVGQDVLFDCNATSNYEVISYFVITNTGSLLRTAALEIKSVTKSNQGNYTCIASNWRAFNNHTYTLIVTESPARTRFVPTTIPPSQNTPPPTTTPESTSPAVHSTSILPVRVTSPPNKTNNNVFVAGIYSLGGIVAAMGILVTISVCRRNKKAKSGDHSPDREQGFEKKSIQAVDAAGARSSHPSRLESTVSVRSTNPLLGHQVSLALSEPGEKLGDKSQSTSSASGILSSSSAHGQDQARQSNPWKSRAYLQWYPKLINVMHPSQVRVLCFALQLLDDYEMEEIDAKPTRHTKNSAILAVISSSPEKFGRFREVLHHLNGLGLKGMVEDLGKLGPDREKDRDCLKARRILET